MAAKKVYRFEAEDAKRENILLRACLCGISGGGKTETALKIATRMRERMGLPPIYLIDSENRSSLRYAYSEKSREGYKFKFVPMPEDDYSPAAYMAAIRHCEAQGAGVIIVDSLTHAWSGINGVLEQVDSLTDQSRSKNAFNVGWKAMTPEHNRLLQTIISAGAHIIGTVRAHTHYELEEKNGKKEPVKQGLAPVQRGGLDYEFDFFAYMENPGNVLRVDKSRIKTLPSGERVPAPDVQFADLVVDFLMDAEAPGEARTLGEAVKIAVLEGVAAGEKKDKEAYVAAKGRLINWAGRRGIAQPRIEAAVAEFKARVAALVPPRAGGEAVPPSAPQSTTGGDALAHDNATQ